MVTRRRPRRAKGGGTDALSELLALRTITLEPATAAERRYATAVGLHRDQPDEVREKYCQATYGSSFDAVRSAAGDFAERYDATMARFYRALHAWDAKWEGQDG